MHVERDARDLGQRFDDQRADRQVGDEVPVHHVDVVPVGAGVLGATQLVTEPREVRGEKRRSDDRLVLAHDWFVPVLAQRKCCARST